MMPQTVRLLSQAREGDVDAFRELVEPHRRELQVHCYRMLGSFQDSEDAVQDTLLAAWAGIARFEGRASPRTWLYRIATNRCLNLRRSAGRRGAVDLELPAVDAPQPNRRVPAVRIEPFPDSLLDGAAVAAGPEARFEQAESVSLAFVAALQMLPPRQVAVLILREVLGFSAAEVADMLDSTVQGVTSTLKRARTGLDQRRADSRRHLPPAPGSAAETALVASFVRAYESADVDTLVALLTDDAFVTMPPMPLEYKGRDAVKDLFTAIFQAAPRSLVPTRANGQPAFALYVHTPTGDRVAAGLIVLELTGDRIRTITRFEGGVLAWFDLPRTLAEQQQHPRSRPHP